MPNSRILIFNFLVAYAILFSTGGSLKANSFAYQDYPFGVFNLYGFNEYRYFMRKAGFTKKEFGTYLRDHAKNLGIRWTRNNMELVWNIVEPELGKGYDWNNKRQTDFKVLQMYHSDYQVNWLGVFHVTDPSRKPPARQKFETRNPFELRKEFKAFVRAAVERYDGDGIDDVALGVKVKYWQVGNELTRMWTAEKYVPFVRLIREAVLEADPEAKIVLIAPTGANRVNYEYLKIIELLAEEKAFEVIDIHHWGMADNYQMTAIAEYRKFLDSKGLEHVEIWSTENGTWNGQPGASPGAPKKPFQTEEDQARSLIKRFVYNLANGVDKLFWNNVVEWKNFHGNPRSQFNSMGLIADGACNKEDNTMFNVPRLSYYTYKLMTETLGNSDWDNIEQLKTPQDTYVFKYIDKKTKQITYVAWTDKKATSKMSFAVDGKGSFKIIETIPNKKFGKYLDIEKSYPSCFKTTSAEAKKGTLTIKLGNTPVFIQNK